MRRMNVYIDIELDKQKVEKLMRGYAVLAYVNGQRFSIKMERESKQQKELRLLMSAKRRLDERIARVQGSVKGVAVRRRKRPYTKKNAAYWAAVASGQGLPTHPHVPHQPHQQ